MYQTSFSGNLHDYGCLFFCLIDVAQEITNREIRTQKAVQYLYDELVGLEYMTDTCYVLDHEKALNFIIQYLGNHHKVYYKGAVYLNDPKKTWGTFGDHQIIQVQTSNNNGHFRRFDYDPWYPGVTIKYVRSVRYYDVK